MTAFAIPGCKVRSPVSWSINDQSSPSGRTRGSGFLGVDVGVLMVEKCFVSRSCPWRRRYHVLYLCHCGTLGVLDAF